MAEPFGCTAIASVNRLLKLKPTCFITIKAIKLAPNSNSTALMICTRWSPTCRQTKRTSSSARQPVRQRCDSSDQTAAQSAYLRQPSARSDTAQPPPGNHRRTEYGLALASDDKTQRLQRCNDPRLRKRSAIRNRIIGQPTRSRVNRSARHNRR